MRGGRGDAQLIQGVSREGRRRQGRPDESESGGQSLQGEDVHTLKRFTKRGLGPYATQADWSRPAIRGED